MLGHWLFVASASTVAATAPNPELLAGLGPVNNSDTQVEFPAPESVSGHRRPGPEEINLEGNDHLTDDLTEMLNSE